MEDLVYFRLDPAHQSKKHVLNRLRKLITARFPVVFGFPVPCSMTRDAEIPYRPRFDSYRGGQVAVAVGYDDHHLPGRRGAVLIRSSWGPHWGDSGYGWLPYSYVTDGLASDFWTVLCERWTDNEHLRAPRR